MPSPVYTIVTQVLGLAREHNVSVPEGVLSQGEHVVSLVDELERAGHLLADRADMYRRLLAGYAQAQSSGRAVVVKPVSVSTEDYARREHELLTGDLAVTREGFVGRVARSSWKADGEFPEIITDDLDLGLPSAAFAVPPTSRSLQSLVAAVLPPPLPEEHEIELDLAVSDSDGEIEPVEVITGKQSFTAEDRLYSFLVSDPFLRAMSWGLDNSRTPGIPSSDLQYLNDVIAPRITDRMAHDAAVARYNSSKKRWIPPVDQMVPQLRAIAPEPIAESIFMVTTAVLKEAAVDEDDAVKLTNDVLGEVGAFLDVEWLKGLMQLPDLSEIRKDLVRSLLDSKNEDLPPESRHTVPPARWSFAPPGSDAVPSWQTDPTRLVGEPAQPVRPIRIVTDFSPWKAQAETQGPRSNPLVVQAPQSKFCPDPTPLARHLNVRRHQRHAHLTSLSRARAVTADHQRRIAMRQRADTIRRITQATALASRTAAMRTPHLVRIMRH